MINLTNEEEIIKVIANYMEKKKKIRITWKAIGKNKHISGKPDIKGYWPTRNRIWCVEVKPTIKKTAKKPHHQRRNYFTDIICQIITRMSKKNTYYAIGLPESMLEYAKRNIPPEARKRIKLYLFLVDKNGFVQLKSPTRW